MIFPNATKISQSDPRTRTTTAAVILADAAVLGLPCEKVQEGAEGLSDEAEGDPENAVAEDFVVLIVVIVVSAGM